MERKAVDSKAQKRTCGGSLAVCHLRALCRDGAVAGVLAAAAVVQVVDERRQGAVRVRRQLQRRRSLLPRVQRARLSTTAQSRRIHHFMTIPLVEARACLGLMSKYSTPCWLMAIHTLLIGPDCCG